VGATTSANWLVRNPYFRFTHSNYHRFLRRKTAPIRARVATVAVPRISSVLIHWEDIPEPTLQSFIVFLGLPNTTQTFKPLDHDIADFFRGVFNEFSAVGFTDDSELLKLFTWIIDSQGLWICRQFVT
jgi:hypothetical protein